jgi:oligopeptide/dipeptide ABC transporter ATP-binding protein
MSFIIENLKMDTQEILIVKDLYKYFPIAPTIIGRFTGNTKKVVHAVDGVSFTLNKGEILALVGESGSGKTTVSMNVLGLQTPTKGQVTLDGHNVADWAHGNVKTRSTQDPLRVDQMNKREQIMSLRRRAQMIFQDPYESLNPRQKVFEIVGEPLSIHHNSISEEDKRQRVKEALEICGLAPADHFWDRYPDGLSGGQRQRVVIAGSLVLDPELLVADEPVSMLDVSIRAELLNLFLKIRDEQNITILYITHDLATAGFFTDRIAVMYLGRIVEIGPTKEVLSKPQHPYTKALISVIPAPNPRRRRERVILEGEVPNPIDLPIGCRFHPRCPVAIQECKKTDPAFARVSNAHKAACLLIPAN